MIESTVNQPSACYPPADFHGYLAATLPPAQHATLANHLSTCLACFRYLTSLFTPNTTPPPGYWAQLVDVLSLGNAHFIPLPCPQWQNNTFSKFWTGLLLTPERDQFQHHLQTCTPCHQHFVGRIKLYNPLQDLHDAEVRALTKQLQYLRLQNDAAFRRGQQLQNYTSKVRGIAQHAQILHQQNQAHLRQLLVSIHQLTAQYHQLAQTAPQLTAQVADLTLQLSRLQKAHNDHTRVSAVNTQSARQTQLDFAAFTSHLAAPDLRTDTKAPTKPLTPESTTMMAATTINNFEVPNSSTPPAPTRAFLKIAAAVLLGTLLLTPLAYYRLPHGDPNSNNAVAIVDSPDITLEDGQRTPLTEATITEIENLIKELQLDKAQILLIGALHKAQDSKDQATLSALLRLQGRILGEKADFPGAIQALNQAITIAQSLNNKQLLLGPVINLTNIYHVTDQNAEAAKQAKYCLDLARETKNIPYQIASLQMLGISKFFAYRSLDSAELVKQSIVLAENQKNYEHVVQGYIYMGVILTENRSFAEANIWFSQAITKVATIKSPQRKIYLSSTINGHQARCKTLSGQYSEALKLYNSSIIQARQAGVKQYLALSQLQRGLSKCYLKLGESKEAEKAEAKAEVFELEAQERCETGNTAMSFAPVQKVAKRCN